MINLDLREVQKLEAEFGNPLYVFDEVSFTRNYREFESILRAHYSKYQVSYSFKTNYSPYICALVNRLGGYAEVVSGMEYDIARKVGFSSENVIFNGPNKGEDGLSALLDGSIINVDNLYELLAVCNKIKSFPKRRFEIGLRVNIDVGQGFISRFGVEAADLEKAFKLVKDVPNLEIVGLHCHISRCRGLDAWKKRTDTLLSLSDRFFRDKPPKFIDLGSGMFGKMDPAFQAQFDYAPSYEEYACVTAKCVAEHYKNIPDSKKPVLITEPGTTLINKYFDFIGRIDAIKKVRGKIFATLNCSVHNLGETSILKKLPVKILNTGGCSTRYEKVDLVGYTCLEQDVMYTDFSGTLGIGDYVQFGNVGGYSNVCKPPFIWPNCAMIAKKENGDYQIIKRPETYDDILHTYVF